MRHIDAILTILRTLPDTLAKQFEQPLPTPIYSPASIPLAVGRDSNLYWVQWGSSKRSRLGWKYTDSRSGTRVTAIDGQPSSAMPCTSTVNMCTRLPTRRAPRPTALLPLRPLKMSLVVTSRCPQFQSILNNNNHQLHHNRHHNRSDYIDFPRSRDLAREISTQNGRTKWPIKNNYYDDEIMTWKFILGQKYKQIGSWSGWPFYIKTRFRFYPHIYHRYASR